MKKTLSYRWSGNNLLADNGCCGVEIPWIQPGFINKFSQTARQNSGCWQGLTEPNPARSTGTFWHHGFQVHPGSCPAIHTHRCVSWEAVLALSLWKSVDSHQLMENPTVTIALSETRLLICSWKGLASRSMKGLVALVVMVRRLSGKVGDLGSLFILLFLIFALIFIFWVGGARNLIFVHSYPLHAKGQLHATGFADSKFPCTFLLCKDQNMKPLLLCMSICSYGECKFCYHVQIQHMQCFLMYTWIAGTRDATYIRSEGSLHCCTLVGFRFSNFAASICCLFYKLQCHILQMKHPWNQRRVQIPWNICDVLFARTYQHVLSAIE